MYIPFFVAIRAELPKNVLVQQIKKPNLILKNEWKFFFLKVNLRDMPILIKVHGIGIR